MVILEILKRYDINTIIYNRFPTDTDTFQYDTLIGFTSNLVFQYILHLKLNPA